ncbi:MAG: cell division protein FtsX [Bacteroidota bacterium]|jgi:cell division transport system permease protein
MSSEIEKYSRRGLRTSYVSTIVGISLVLFLIGLILGGVMGVNDFQKQAKENIVGDIFFKENFNEADIKQVEVQLKKWTEFSSIRYLSPDAALASFYENQTDKKELNEIFEGENPLPPCITFSPNQDFATKEGMGQIKAKLLKAFPTQIIEVSYNESNIENINLGFKQFIFLILLIAIIMIVIAIAMINNTIRLALYSKRFTIKTMQLVGAKGAFIRKPFLIQAVLQGIVSAFVGLALLVTLFYSIQNYFDELSITYSPKLFVFLTVSLLTLGIIITFISTWIALNKYLKMKIDDLY